MQPIPPSSEDLVFDDGDMMSPRQNEQIWLLIDTLQEAWADRDDFYVSGNVPLYYSAAQLEKEEFFGPDVFVVLNTTRRERQHGWVVWDEGGKAPDVIIEVTSRWTESIERGEKMRL